MTQLLTKEEKAAADARLDEIAKEVMVKRGEIPKNPPEKFGEVKIRCPKPGCGNIWPYHFSGIGVRLLKCPKCHELLRVTYSGPNKQDGAPAEKPKHLLPRWFRRDKKRMAAYHKEQEEKRIAAETAAAERKAAEEQAQRDKETAALSCGEAVVGPDESNE
jgi:uncharacterized C2H2 Zn-finger protein